MAELPTRKFNPKSIKRAEKNYHLKHVLTTKESADKLVYIEHGLKRLAFVHEVSSSEVPMAFGVFVKK
jgi:hypothetical protein